MKSRIATGAVALTMSLIAASAASAAADGPMSAIRAFVKAVNAGDVTAARATHADGSISIIDEFRPYAWVGDTAFADWLAAFAADSKAKGDTETKASLGAPIRVETDGATAYAVVHAALDYKEHDTPMHEATVWTFALEKTPAGWKIKAWAWGGHKPAAAKPAVPPATK